MQSGATMAQFAIADKTAFATAGSMVCLNLLPKNLLLLLVSTLASAVCLHAPSESSPGTQRLDVQGTPRHGHEALLETTEIGSGGTFVNQSHRNPHHEAFSAPNLSFPHAQASEPKKQIMRRESFASSVDVDVTGAVSLNTEVLPKKMVVAPTRRPAYKRTHREPIVGSSVGHNPTPPLVSHKVPPWAASLGDSPLDPGGLSQSHSSKRIEDAFHQGKISLLEASRLAKASRGVERTECDPASPPDEFEKCKKSENEENGENGGNEKGNSTELQCNEVKCETMCCCFYPSMYRLGWKLYPKVKEFAMYYLVQLAAQTQGFSNMVLVILPRPGKTAPEDEEEERRWTAEVSNDMVKWWLYLMGINYVLCRIHELCVGCWRRACRVRKNFAEAELNLSVEDPANPRKTGMFTTEVETNRLGGIERSVMVHVKSINRWQWHLAVFFSVGLFYWVMKTPEQLSLMILGKSGRVLFLARKPMTPLKGAFVMFLSFGMGLMAVFSMLLFWFRSIERSLQLAEKSSDPAVRMQAHNAGGFYKGLVGKVHVYALAVFLVMWLLEAAILVCSIRPWAGSDQRDYYEAEECTSAQYFRGGSRPWIPIICPRRREGGLRLFFGPYPDSEIWNQMGRRFRGLFLQNLEPLIVVPGGGDIRPSPSNGASDTSGEERTGAMQNILGAFNWLLGAIGTLCFIIHMFNLAQNVEMCPFEKVVRPCVEANDCTLYGQSGWFQLYMERAGLASREELAERAIAGALTQEDIGIWLSRNPKPPASNSSSETEPDTKTQNQIPVEPDILATVNASVPEAIVLIAQKSCMDRRTELIDEPQGETKAKKADTLGKFNSGNYNLLRAAMGVDIVWDMQALDCKECQRSTIMHYFTNIENSLEVIEILILSFTIYISSTLVKIANNRLKSASMGDLQFESDPSSAADMPIEKIEKACTEIMRDIFFFRYRGGKLPKPVKRLEEKN